MHCAARLARRSFPDAITVVVLSVISQAKGADELGRRALPLRAIGHAAHGALAASGGVLEMLAGFDAAPYARASGEIIWIGHGDVAMHPRAVVLERAARVAAGDRLDARALTPWRPSALPRGANVAAALRSGGVVLARNLPRLAHPTGFALLLAGGVPPFPFDRAVAQVRAFARAFDGGDSQSACEAGLPLLGLGPGLTPAGDDLVGAALFARRTMAAAPSEAAAWARVAARLIEAARERSHPVAAALFRDLATLQSFAPLHRLAAGLAAQADDDEVLDAMRALVAIGHSSGFEMLAGFMIGIGGSAMLALRQETT